MTQGSTLLEVASELRRFALAATQVLPALGASALASRRDPAQTAQPVPAIGTSSRERRRRSRARTAQVRGLFVVGAASHALLRGWEVSKEVRSW